MSCFLGPHVLLKKTLMFLAEIVQAGLIENSAVVGTIVDLEMDGWVSLRDKKTIFSSSLKIPQPFLFLKHQEANGHTLGNGSLMGRILHVKAKLYFISDLRGQRDFMHSPACLRAIAPKY